MGGWLSASSESISPACWVGLPREMHHFSTFLGLLLGQLPSSFMKRQQGSGRLRLQETRRLLRRRAGINQTLPPVVPGRKEKQARPWAPAVSSTMETFTANHTSRSTYQRSAKLAWPLPALGRWGERKVVTLGKLGNVCPSQPHSHSKQEPDTPQFATPGEPLGRACSHPPGGLASIWAAG